MILRGEAPAKINRELRVGGRRPDGFHEIRSRFAAIDLADSIEVEEAKRFALICDPPGLAVDRSNLVSRAAFALAERHGVEPRARVRLEKRVPIGAGLGGGSSDAAAALLLLARLWGLPSSPEDLAPVAVMLGSDVAFFLLGGEADVTGRGERVTPREDGPAAELLLLVPPFSIPTASVYAGFDRMGPPPPLPERLEIEESGRFLGPNDLASAVLAVRSEMGAYLRSARDVAREAGITGSGSAIVLAGVDEDAATLLSRRHPEAAFGRCRPLGRREYRLRTGTTGGSAWK